jgi:hypothetical protein
MQPDAATRILLALILLCLVILIVEGFTGRAERSDAVGRYSVTGMRAGGPILVRTDSATGQVWKLELRGNAADSWALFREPDGASAPRLDQSDQERADPLGGDQTLE